VPWWQGVSHDNNMSASNADANPSSTLGVLFPDSRLLTERRNGVPHVPKNLFRLFRSGSGDCPCVGPDNERFGCRHHAELACGWPKRGVQGALLGPIQPVCGRLQFSPGRRLPALPAGLPQCFYCLPGTLRLTFVPCMSASYGSASPSRRLGVIFIDSRLLSGRGTGGVLCSANCSQRVSPWRR